MPQPSAHKRGPVRGIGWLVPVERRDLWGRMCRTSNWTSDRAADRALMDWRNMPCEIEHKEFLKKFSDCMLQWVFEGVNRKEPVTRWRESNHLKELLELKLQDLPQSQERILKISKDVFRYSIKSGHPYVFSQLFSGLDPYGLAGQWLTDLLSVSMHTYETTPILTLMEKTLIQKLSSMFFIDNDASDITGEGLFCPGGAFANGMAINLARFWSTSNIKKHGHPGSKLVFFVSEDAHRSISRWASICGLGDNSVLLIRTDYLGRMDTRDLEAKILDEREKGNHGFMVCATAGTLVLGAFDPLVEIARICEKFNMWMHVDAAWGGGVIFSGKYGGLLRGISRADSITFNPHNLLGVSPQCCVLLTRHSDVVKRVNIQEALESSQNDKYDIDFDDIGLQGGQRPDILKFWFMWLAKGSLGFEKHVNHLMALAASFKEKIEKREGFQLVTQPCFINVCFWYIPPNLRGQESVKGFEKLLDKVAPKLKEMMTKRGSLMMSCQPLRNQPNFFRFIVQNSGVEMQDLNYILNELENLGSYLVH
ncbi:cysteine sulfinic acid decarboxylase [Orussus abietinus]|uniref:cysteine sulfinic acid decarboxylase n=1 Tax=Orussus abietinus TaxID=222816 RepID=UPI0006265779|nr:cysteine sulfinic acid decarboxylase [Orussus abietinus]